MGSTRHGVQSKPHLTLAVSDGRPLPDDGQSPDLAAIYTFLAPEIEDRMGADFLTKVPYELLQSYCLATVRQNEPTAALLYELITNFMKAYANPETNADALKAFDYLSHLSEVASKQ
ncbi:hypothetical protein NPS53_08710 [Pseudomonas putida]|uniref:hypothetical protein n=1 Tax=Pseudomonas putida TaxID=303 RepID=UPI002363888C|nr:hypothetical protein [Pseudomonas putida]MDD2139654.1 hypothetical protein [Pseudomonas putida]HDS1721578.1 hypothetical protein [Pseudomonas putida]